MVSDGPCWIYNSQFHMLLHAAFYIDVCSSGSRRGVAQALLVALAHPGDRGQSAKALTSCPLQDDFGVDQDDVYEVVAAWNEHSEDVESYVALQEESGLDTEGLREAVRQWRQHKDDDSQYEALRRDTGMDGEGMRKVSSMVDG